MTLPTTDRLLHGAYTPTSARPDAPAPAPAWSPAKRVAFRFAAAYLALYVVPDAIVMLPVYGDRFFDWYAGRLWGGVVAWTGAHVLGLAKPVQYRMTGSGDTTFDWVYLVCLIALAAVVTVVWSAVDRRRREYAVAYDRLRIVVRYGLGAIMMGYGAAKVFQSQFPAPYLDRLLEPYGRSSPMGLLWTFMGMSYAYNLFAGIGECVGGLLLLARRTTTLGALVSAAVLSNVVMLNLAYDVPVKLFSMHLLLMAAFLALPDLRRLADVLVLGRPAPAAEIAPAVRGAAARRARVAAKVAFVLLAVVAPLVSAYRSARGFADVRRSTPLYGIYDVAEQERNQQPVPALFTDSTRWRRVVVQFPGAVSVHLATDSVRRYQMAVDTVAHRLTIRSYKDSSVVAALAYAAAPDGLLLTGTQRGDSLRLRLRRVDHTKFLLVSRGFHWVSEVPFNR